MPTLEERIQNITDGSRLCPVCGRIASDIRKIEEDKGEVGFWSECMCGVIFQLEPPEYESYDQDYRDNYLKIKNLKDLSTNAARIYSPLIEELAQGRKMLEVGYSTLYNMEFFRDRGWVYYGIDIDVDNSENNRILNGNFEKYDFGITQYSLIWMSHVFEHFQDPLNVLRKCRKLLKEDGCLYIQTPDIDFIKTQGVGSFGHWNHKEHHIMWSKRALVRELEQMGFEVIMARRNFHNHFTSWNDVHLIAQKVFF